MGLDGTRHLVDGIQGGEHQPQFIYPQINNYKEPLGEGGGCLKEAEDTANRALWFWENDQRRKNCKNFRAMPVPHVYSDVVVRQVVPMRFIASLGCAVTNYVKPPCAVMSPACVKLAGRAESKRQAIHDYDD